MLQRDRLTQKSGDYCRDVCGQAGSCQRLDHARRHNDLSLRCRDALRYERLREYENTGLAPEEVIQLNTRKAYIKIDDSIKNIEILPCPFCGSGANLMKSSKGYSSGQNWALVDGWKVECSNGCCKTKEFKDEIYHADSGEVIVEHNGAYEAVVAWNTRKN